MGSISFESWDAAIDDVQALNGKAEISRLGLVFEDYGGGAISAQADGNVSAYYVIVQELLQHLGEGSFNCEVVLSTGKKRLQITRRYVLESGKDISKLFVMKPKFL